jgi:hypothetical protein
VIRDLYIENSVGRAVTETINRFTHNHGVTAHFQHDVHPEMQRPQQGDEWWVADIAGRGMGILTQDAAILGIRPEAQGVITAERRAVIDNSAHVSLSETPNTPSGRSSGASLRTGTGSTHCSASPGHEQRSCS